MITNQQSIDPECLGIEEGIMRTYRSSFGEVNRIDFMGRLGAGGSVVGRGLWRLGRNKTREMELRSI